MAWSFSSDRPVFVQLADALRKQIVAGEYAPSEQIPSVRQLAIETAVNPNTVQRALSLLETEGLVESRGTLGRFVTSDITVIRKCLDQNAKLLVANFIENAKKMSISDEDIIQMVKEELENERT